MRGSVYKRGSTWTWHVDVGVDPVTGRRRQQTKGGFKTKRECQAALNDALAALRAGTFVELPALGPIPLPAALPPPPQRLL